MSKTTFRFEEPKYLTLCLPNSEYPFDVDLYECWNVVIESDSKPDQASRWKHLQDFILKKHNENLTKLNFESEDSKEVWEGTAREFRDLTIKQMNLYQEIIKKKFDLIVSLDITTQLLQVQGGNSGQSGTNDVG